MGSVEGWPAAGSTWQPTQPPAALQLQTARCGVLPEAFLSHMNALHMSSGLTRAAGHQAEGQQPHGEEVACHPCGCNQRPLKGLKE